MVHIFGNAFVATEDGQFVSAEHQRIAEIIADYDPDLQLLWIPPANREPGDAPFAVLHSPAGKPPYVVCYADDCDERLLARVFSMDSAKQDIWSEIEKSEAAREAIKLKRDMDEAEERKDLVEHIIKSPKATYKHDGIVYE